MAKQPIEFVTPVGRLVAGNPYEPKTEDSDGKPLVGRDKVTPRVEYFVGIAIPKGGESHWAQTEWGQKLWAAAHAGYPNAGNLGRNFSWKLTDGDSQEPNKKMVKPCDREGYPGHWVLYFSSGYAPKICNKDGTQQILEEGAVKPGYFIQIAGSGEFVCFASCRFEARRRVTPVCREALAHRAQFAGSLSEFDLDAGLGHARLGFFHWRHLACRHALRGDRRAALCQIGGCLRQP